MQLGGRIWTVHPMDTLEQWDTSKLIETHSFSVTSRTLIPLLTSRGIFPSTEGKYLVDQSTAKHWLSAFIEAYRRMENILFCNATPPNLKTQQSTSWTQNLPTPDTLTEGFPSILDLFISCMIFFREFQRCLPIRFILNQPSLAYAFENSESKDNLAYDAASDGMSRFVVVYLST